MSGLISDSAQLDRLNAYIDLNRYPIHELDSTRGQQLIIDAQAMMRSETICLFEGFLRPDAVRELSSEITALEERAHKVNYLSTAYGWMNNSGFPSEHPRSKLLRRQCGVISKDMLDQKDPCNELYEFDALTDLVRRLLGYDQLYRTACPTLSIQINIMCAGEIFGWHFDTNDGVVSFTIQNADEGGGFEYAPLIRSEDDENYEAVSKIMDEGELPRQPDMSPGTMSLFLGRRSLHRTAPISSTTRSRQSLLFSYDQTPGMVFPEQTCRRLTSESSESYLGALTPVS